MPAVINNPKGPVRKLKRDKSGINIAEFFELGKRKMSSGSVWAQWLQTFSLRTEDLTSLLRTFATVFSHVRVFRINAGDLLLIGSERPLPLHTRMLGHLLAG